MGIQVTHDKVLTVPDKGDPALVRPSNWNAAHAVALTGALKALDGLTASADKMPVFTGGETAELQTVSSFFRSLMAAAGQSELLALIGSISAEDLAAKAPLNSPNFIGAPIAPTPPPGSNTAQLATTAFVTGAIADLVSGAEDFLDGLDAVNAAIALKQDLHANLTAFAGLSLLSDKGIYANGSGTLATFALTAKGRALIGSADEAAMRTFLGLGTAATQSYGTAANNIVRLDASARLPAVDGSQLTNLPTSNFPAGTKMLFVQSSAPTGWTKDTTHNDKALRIVSGSVSSGGALDFSAVFARTATDAHTLTTAQIPAQTHTLKAYSGYGVAAAGASNYPASAAGNDTNPMWAVGSNVNNAAAVVDGNGGGAHAHGMDIRVKYVDAIIAIKD